MNNAWIYMSRVKNRKWEMALIPNRVSSFIESFLRTNSHLRLIKLSSNPDFKTSDGRHCQHLILDKTHVIGPLEEMLQPILFKTGSFWLSISDGAETWFPPTISLNSDLLEVLVCWFCEERYLERVNLGLFSTITFESFGKTFATFLVFLLCLAPILVSGPAFMDLISFSPVSFMIKQVQVFPVAHLTSVAVPSLQSSGQLREFFHSKRFNLSRADVYQLFAVSSEITLLQVLNLLWHKSPRYSYRVASSANLHFEQQNGVLLSFKICSAHWSSSSAKSQSLFLTYSFPSKSHQKMANHTNQRMKSIHGGNKIRLQVTYIPKREEKETVNNGSCSEQDMAFPHLM